MNDIQDELKHLHNIMSIQSDSISEINKQAIDLERLKTALVTDNAEIAKKIKSLHEQLREDKEGK